MSQECDINHSDFILYTSVLLVLVLIFPMLDLIIIRLTWFYKDDLFIPRDIERKTAKLSQYNKKGSFFPKSISSHSSRSHPVHPLARTQATLVFSNSESRDLDESGDTQMRLEDTIIYGKSSVKQPYMKAKTTTQIRRSFEDYSLSSKDRGTQQSPVLQRHTPVRIESLPGIETPLELSARRRTQQHSQETDVRGETFQNIHTELAEVTRVTPIMKLPAIQPAPNTAYKSSEFIEKLADTSVLYQDKYEVAYASSRTNLIDTSSRDSTPKQGETKLLNRPDKNRRKLAKLDLSNP